MKIITMYELLGLVKDGKAPKKIKIVSNNYNKEFYFDGDIYMYKDEYDVEHAMTDDISIEMLLNDEVEILKEEKKIPEKLNTWYGIEPVNLDSPNTFKDNSKYIDFNTEMFFDKINEIIDYLKSKGE